MAEIESPIGKTTFSSGPQNQKVFTVEDSSGQAQGPGPQAASVSPGEQVDYEALRRRKIEELRAAQNISFNSKQRVEILTGIGRNTKDFSFENVQFSLRTLKSRELRQVLLDVSHLQDVTLTFELRANTLARSLYLIDGHDINDVIGSSSMKDKVNFIHELEENVVDILYKQYLLLVEETEEKYGLKDNSSKEEVAEAVDSVKK
jgi:hypothetical protein